jgi:hypothetical protein
MVYAWEEDMAASRNLSTAHCQHCTFLTCFASTCLLLEWFRICSAMVYAWEEDIAAGRNLKHCTYSTSCTY